ncbi:MAG: hypothetical protein NUV84_03815 [Candidatus Uhrbacteria bacterium]|nr:hypothetical protein [Candidatus Uhrbacteria bacterium]
MGTSARKKDSSLSIVIVVAIVLIASALLIVRPSPEQVVAMSTDSLLRVQGVTRSSGTVVIQRLDGVSTSIPELASPVYEATLTGEGTLEDAEFTFSFSDFDSGLAIQDVAVYVFNREMLTWESLPTFFDLENQTLTAHMEFSGSILVGLGIRML